MAHKKGAGSTRNGRDSESKRLGIKLFGGQFAKAGNIIVRQRGTKHHPGDNVGIGKDHTLFALQDGIIVYKRKRKNRSYVSVIDQEAYSELMGLDIAPKKEITKAKPSKKETAPKTEAKAPAESTKEVAEVKKQKPKAAKEEKATETSVEPADLLNTLGTAEESDKQDLKKISGIGPAFEKKLNNLGIYTYAQISKLTEKEMDMLAELTGFSKARMISNNWVEEAKGFAG